MPKKLFPSINRKLLPIKVHYFLFTLGTAPILGNLSMIARQKGLSPSIVGIIFTVLNLVSTITKPILGGVADRFKKRKFLLMVMQAVKGISFFGLYFIPSFSNEVIVKSSPQNTEIYFCPKTPIWDKCLEGRIHDHETKIFKCHLRCKSQFWMKENICENQNGPLNCIPDLRPFESEIIIDMRTMERNSSCIALKEFNDNNLNNSTNFFNNGAPLYARLYEINCEATCDDEFLKGALANRGTTPDDEIIHKYQFWLFCILLLIGCSSNSVVNSMADTICFDLLGDDSHKYGRQRMWDSIGGGVAAASFGIIIDTMSHGSAFKNYTVVYFFCLTTSFLGIICIINLKYTQPKKSKSIIKDVSQVFKSAKFITFAFWCCFGGFCSAAVWSFVFWHLEELTEKIGQDECGGNYVKTLEGIDMVFQTVIGEIPFFFWSGYILKKIGHVNCMHLVCGAFAIRFFYYSQLWNPWWVLPVEVLNGVTYGLLFSTMTSYANFLAPPGAEATLQGLVGSLFDGVGVSLGNFSAGTLFSTVGGHQTFFIFGITAISAMTIHIIVHALLNVYDKKTHNVLPEMVMDEEL